MTDLDAVQQFIGMLVVHHGEATENALYMPLEIAVNYCDAMSVELAAARAVVEAARAYENSKFGSKDAGWLAQTLAIYDKVRGK